MKMRIANTVLLCLLFAAFAFASPRQQDEPKPKEASPAMKHPEGKPEAKPESQEQKPDEMKPEKNNRDKQEKDAKEEQNENRDQEKQEQKEEKKSDKGKNNKEMGNMRDENRGNAHPAGKGGHIPDDKFRSNFGRSHTFHPSRPTMVNNQATFVYGGYSFILVDPWPVGWAYTDDCYIDYVDGEYFLFDALHPGVRIALFVSM